MKFRKIAASIAALGLMSLSSTAHAEWLEAKSKHFTVYGDMPEKNLRERTQRLEKFDAALRALFPSKLDDMATVYIVNSLDDIQRLSGSSQVLGYYKTSAQGALGFVPETLPFSAPGLTAERILYHEYTHHMLLSNTSEYFPRWATEGLAEMFMSANFDEKGGVVIGAPNAFRARSVGAMTRWTAARLIDSDGNPPKGDEKIELYTRGWLMCHYLLISGKRPGQFRNFVSAINSGVPYDKAAKDTFGDIKKLDDELERYVRASAFPSSVLSADKIKASTEVSVRHLSEGEAAILPYRMTSANGVTAKTAGPLAEKARAVAAKYPNDAFVQRAMAEMDFDAATTSWQKDKKLDTAALALAEADADRALAIDPANVMAMMYKGRVIAMRALQAKDANLWREARRWFLKGNQTDPNFALPFQLFYDSYVAAGVVPPVGAATGIRRAVVLVPADMTLRARAAIELIRAGDLKMARTVMAPIAFDPHGSDKNPFAKLVKAMDAGGTKESVLAVAAELKLDRINEFDPPKLGEEDKAADKPADKSTAKSVLR